MLKVVVPILLASLAVRFAVALPWPHLDLPTIDLPTINLPTPDLPSIPWPDWHLPDIPWPDWHLPAWVSWLLDHAHYVWPVILAFVLARAELRRRRQQEARKATRQDGDPS